MKDLFDHIFFENVTAAESALMTDQDSKMKSLGNIRYLHRQIEVDAAG